MSRTPRSPAAPRRRSTASPYDAQAALEQLLDRLRSSSGATRVSVWVHESTTELVIPFRETLEQLRVALDSEQLDDHYQPQVDLRTGAVVGVEALVRWNHPERGLLYPGVFLPLAELAGLVRRLALRVLECALRDLQTWRTQGHDVSVAVNLSVSDLRTSPCPTRWRCCSTPSPCRPVRWCWRSPRTSSWPTPARSQQLMAGLRRLGVRLSVDDYGTGYSSLSYLRALPVDELELDRSFVAHLTTDARAAAIVRSTLRLNRDLGMSMVVEGVEDADSLAALREWGCDIAQGYHISRPMPAERVLSWLTSRPVPAALKPGGRTRH